MTKEAPLACIIIGETSRKFPDLANVVKQGARQKRLAIKFGIHVGMGAAQLDHAQGMFQQAADIGVMNAFCGWIKFQCPGEIRVIKNTENKASPRLVTKLFKANYAQAREHLLGIIWPGWQKIPLVDLSLILLIERRETLQGDLELVAIKGCPA